MKMHHAIYKTILSILKNVRKVFDNAIKLYKKRIGLEPWSNSVEELEILMGNKIANIKYFLTL